MFRSNSKLLLLGYVLLFFSVVILDQTTKFHAEKSYMEWYDQNDSRGYRSTQERIFTLGTSPAKVSETAGEPAVITPNWLDFHLTYVRNHGAAWGSFSNLPEVFRLWGFYAITIIVSGFVLFMLKNTEPGLRAMRTALVFILAGAAGNFIDRIALKYVIDWLSFHWKIFGWEYAFPVFNVADISINVGMGLMLLDMLLNEFAMKRANLAVTKDTPSAAMTPPS